MGWYLHLFWREILVNPLGPIPILCSSPENRIDSYPTYSSKSHPIHLPPDSLLSSRLFLVLSQFLLDCFLYLRPKATSPS